MLHFNLNRDISTTGGLGIFNISNEVSVRFVVENAGAGNTFVVSGKIIAQTAWTTIGTLSGSANEAFFVDTYDEIKIECTVFDSLGNNTVKLIACSFDK